MTERNVQWVVCEMTADMKTDVEKQVNLAIDKYDGGTEMQISECIKKFFDSKYAPNWHCVVGKNFASHVSYENKTFIFFYIGKTAICLYKA